MCARFYLIMYDYWPKFSATPERLARLEELAAICRKRRLEAAIPGQGQAPTGLDGRIIYYCNRMRQQLNPKIGKARKPFRSRSAKRDFGHLRFEPLELSVKRLASNSNPRFDWKWQTHSGWGCLNRWTACGPGLDLAWHKGAILFMHRPNLLEEVFIDPKPVFADVRWDGRHVWIATHHEGIWVVDPSGRSLSELWKMTGFLLPIGEYCSMY